MKHFLPMSSSEMDDLEWEELDVLIISGDVYVDHPSFAAAVIGRVLEAEDLRVGIIAQPDWKDPESIKGMGRPRLFCGVTAGNLDSMVANYSAARRKRKEDSYSEGGETGKRPNHAAVVYTQLAKGAFPGLPIVIGGIEASLRRTVHYDYWQDKLRPSILESSKADILVYGMGERAIREVASRIASDECRVRSDEEGIVINKNSRSKTELSGIPGTAVYLGGNESEEIDMDSCVVLPSFDECKKDKAALIELTKKVEAVQNPFSGRPLVQFHGTRAVYIEPPALPLSTEEFDRVYDLPYMRKPHPSYRKDIPAFIMIKDSLTAVRGCGGGCSFCGLGMHQGKFISSRSPESIEREVDAMNEKGDFRGTITDIGGPTANLYGCVNGVSQECQDCRRPSCLNPDICRNLEIGAENLIRLMQRIRERDDVKHLFVQSGVRMDVALRNPEYIKELVRNHVSGHLKVAPEHLHRDVLKRMRKPGPEVFEKFSSAFERESREADKEQYIVPYFISNFPGSTSEEMKVVENFLKQKRWDLQQVQDYIPLPMTPAAAMYYTGLDYPSGKPIKVTRGLAERRTQQKQLQGKRKPEGGKRK